jgi:hypothetical protein
MISRRGVEPRRKTKNKIGRIVVESASMDEGNEGEPADHTDSRRYSEKEYVNLYF